MLPRQCSAGTISNSSNNQPLASSSSGDSAGHFLGRLSTTKKKSLSMGDLGCHISSMESVQSKKNNAPIAHSGANSDIIPVSVRSESGKTPGQREPIHISPQFRAMDAISVDSVARLERSEENSNEDNNNNRTNSKARIVPPKLILSTFSASRLELMHDEGDYTAQQLALNSLEELGKSCTSEEQQQLVRFVRSVLLLPSWQTGVPMGLTKEEMEQRMPTPVDTWLQETLTRRPHSPSSPSFPLRVSTVQTPASAGIAGILDHCNWPSPNSKNHQSAFDSFNLGNVTATSAAAAAAAAVASTTTTTTTTGNISTINALGETSRLPSFGNRQSSASSTSSVLSEKISIPLLNSGSFTETPEMVMVLDHKDDSASSTSSTAGGGPRDVSNTLEYLFLGAVKKKSVDMEGRSSSSVDRRSTGGKTRVSIDTDEFDDNNKDNNALEPEDESSPSTTSSSSCTSTSEEPRANKNKDNNNNNNSIDIQEIKQVSSPVTNRSPPPGSASSSVGSVRRLNYENQPASLSSSAESLNLRRVFDDDDCDSIHSTGLPQVLRNNSFSDDVFSSFPNPTTLGTPCGGSGNMTILPAPSFTADDFSHGKPKIALSVSACSSRHHSNSSSLASSPSPLVQVNTPVSSVSQQLLQNQQLQRRESDGVMRIEEGNWVIAAEPMETSDWQERDNLEGLDSGIHGIKASSSGENLSKYGDAEERRCSPFLNTSSNLCPEAIDELSKLEVIESVTRGSFNIFKLAELTGGKPLQFVTMHVIKKYGLIHRLGLSVEKLCKFLEDLEADYVSYLPYHNSTHAADVVVTVDMMLEAGMEEVLSPLEILAMLLAAASHDVGHNGVGNSFHVKTISSLAVQYNNRSVLENFHCSAAWKLLTRKECNVLAPLSSIDLLNFRAVFVDAIMGTDMQIHAELVQEVRTTIDRYGDYVKQWLPPARQALVYFMVHFADIGHTCRPLPITRDWTCRVTSEFLNQGDLEKHKQLIVSFDRDVWDVAGSQVKFIRYAIFPTLEVIVRLFPRLSSLLVAAETTYSYWRSVEDGEDAFEFKEYKFVVPTVKLRRRRKNYKKPASNSNNNNNNNNNNDGNDNDNRQEEQEEQKEQESNNNNNNNNNNNQEQEEQQQQKQIRHHSREGFRPKNVFDALNNNNNNNNRNFETSSSSSGNSNTSGNMIMSAAV